MSFEVSIKQRELLTSFTIKKFDQQSNFHFDGNHNSFGILIYCLPVCTNCTVVSKFKFIQIIVKDEIEKKKIIHGFFLLIDIDGFPQP